MHRYFLILIIASLSLVGCRTPQTIKDAWKSSRSYYYEYLNTPAELDLDDKGKALDYQSQLGAAIAEFDLQLQELEKAMHNSDHRPDAEWVASMTMRFPWLSGIALTDDYGIPHAKIPVEFPKSFEIGSLLEVDPKQQLKDLRAFVQMHDLGPEIYIGNPVYMGADFRGVITVHFDPRVLLARTGDPAKIMIAGADGVLWPGMYDAAATPVAGTNWGELVKEKHSGLVRNELGTFYWVTRYIGNLPLVYAVKVEGDFPVNENNMRSLVEANAFAVGRISISDLQTQTTDAAAPLPDLDRPADIAPDGANSPLTAPSDVPFAGPGESSTPLSE